MQKVLEAKNKLENRRERVKIDNLNSILKQQINPQKTWEIFVMENIPRSMIH